MLAAWDEVDGKGPDVRVEIGPGFVQESGGAAKRIGRPDYS
jgi:hypothetical protein